MVHCQTQSFFKIAVSKGLNRPRPFWRSISKFKDLENILWKMVQKLGEVGFQNLQQFLQCCKMKLFKGNFQPLCNKQSIQNLEKAHLAWNNLIQRFFFGRRRGKRGWHILEIVFPGCSRLMLSFAVLSFNLWYVPMKCHFSLLWGELREHQRSLHGTF